MKLLFLNLCNGSKTYKKKLKKKGEKTKTKKKNKNKNNFQKIEPIFDFFWF